VPPTRRLSSELLLSALLLGLIGCSGASAPAPHDVEQSNIGGIEALSSLDWLTQSSTIGLLQRLRSTSNISLLMISCDPVQVAQICDRVAVIRSGRLCDVGAIAGAAPTDMEIRRSSQLGAVGA
jgi:hypothetical protein